MTQIYTVQSSSFHIGFTFYYWDYYQDLEQFEPTSIYNINDHQGYSPSELFVKPKYASFKEELTNYYHLQSGQYEQEIKAKIDAYIHTKLVKCTAARYGISEYYVQLYYEVKAGTPLQFNHLLSIILYTDYTELSTHFSATLRSSHPFESLKAIKSRNSDYYWMSRYLREVVQLYGDHSYPGDLKGPFYSGLSCKIVFPEYQLRLASPTSTSRAIEVAVRFSGENGIIVKLNNTVYGHDYLRGFSCQWISRYKGESEVLFYGGTYRTNIESVISVGSRTNYQAFFTALNKFNDMFNGCYVSKRRLSTMEISIILGLIEWKLKGCDFNEIENKYIYETFLLFTSGTRYMVLDLNKLADNEPNILKILMLI